MSELDRYYLRKGITPGIIGKMIRRMNEGPLALISDKAAIEIKNTDNKVKRSLEIIANLPPGPKPSDKA